MASDTLYHCNAISPLLSGPIYPAPRDRNPPPPPPPSEINSAPENSVACFLELQIKSNKVLCSSNQET